MFLKVYADESYDSQIYCCGGFFGWPKDFYYLGLKWKDRLKQDNLAYFHAADCQHLKGEFRHFSTSRAEAVRRDLTAIITEEHIVGISLGVVAKDFRSLVVSNPEARQYFGKDIMIASYRLLIKVAVELMENDWPEREHSNLKIDFVFDVHANWEKAEAAYEYTRANNPFCEKRMLKASHDDDRDLPALQMADLLAYECRLRTKEWMKASANERDTLKTLRAAHNIYFMGFMGTRELTDEMNRSAHQPKPVTK